MVMDHETCSELLAAFVRGELPEDIHAEVSKHLETCEDCRLERAAAAALAVALEPMTELERRRLHSSLGKATGTIRPGRARIAAALGVAATIAVLAVGFAMKDRVVSPSLTEGSADTVDRPSTEELFGTPAQDEAIMFESAPAGAPPQPTFAAEVRTMSSSEMSRLGSSKSPFIEFATFYSVADIDAYYSPYTRQLASQAPDDLLSRKIKDCIKTVSDKFPYHLLPAFAASGEVDGRPSLIVGFAWTERPIGALDQYMLWAWPDGDCTSTTPVYLTGEIGESE